MLASRRTTVWTHFSPARYVGSWTQRLESQIKSFSWVAIVTNRVEQTGSGERLRGRSIVQPLLHLPSWCLGHVLDVRIILTSLSNSRAEEDTWHSGKAKAASGRGKSGGIGRSEVSTDSSNTSGFTWMKKKKLFSPDMKCSHLLSNVQVLLHYLACLCQKLLTNFWSINCVDILRIIQDSVVARTKKPGEEQGLTLMLLFIVITLCWQCIRGTPLSSRWLLHSSQDAQGSQV